MPKNTIKYTELSLLLKIINKNLEALGYNKGLFTYIDNYSILLCFISNKKDTI